MMNCVIRDGAGGKTRPTSTHRLNTSATRRSKADVPLEPWNLAPAFGVRRQSAAATALLGAPGLGRLHPVWRARKRCRAPLVTAVQDADARAILVGDCRDGGDQRLSALPRQFRLHLGPSLAALGLLASLAFVALPGRAAVIEAWVQRYSGNAVKLVSDSNGDIIITGSTYDSVNSSVTIKYSGGDGHVLWQRSYGGPVNGYYSSSGVTVDSSGNVAVTGYTIGIDGYPDYYTAKYAAADGALLWEKRSNDGGEVVAVDGSGNVVVTGVPGTGPTTITTPLSMQRRTARCFGRNATTVWPTATTELVRWRWTPTAT